MEADITVNDSTRIWIESSDNVSFVIAAKLSVGKTIIGDPIERQDLKLFAEDLLDGHANQILHIGLTVGEARAVGERLLALANGRW